ncbi:lanthionine synthetase LanC family protein [Spirosoma sp.]|uniref:lanthionine synthetase LanC family protein n=1 Tax=Spirosoma sp. TaxID=1899569 RepID=UPI00261E241B|nr:lanthionine synthetase LanC family protein [Spirosoma sp.]MCX6212989.1 hypothetical protein [Spirosoma sp.]
MKAINSQTHLDSLNRIIACIPSVENRLTNAGYAYGRLGLSLFYCYCGRYFHDDEYYDKAQDYLNQVLQLLESPDYLNKRKLAYVRELAEVGTFLLFATNNSFLEADVEPLLAYIDEVLTTFMTQKIADDDINEYSGASRAGNYFLIRQHSNPDVRRQLKELATAIENTAHEDSVTGGVYWKGPLYKREGVYLGLANGSAARIMFLSALYRQGIQADRCKIILERAVTYLLAQQQNFPGGAFPMVVGDSPGATPLLLPCGDLGISYALLRASEVLTNDVIQAKALELARVCTLRSSLEETYIRDAQLNYGAAGTALLFDKLGRQTGRPEFQAAANSWYARLPSFATFNNEFAGYESAVNKTYPFTFPCFNEGIIGIGLSLMRYLQVGLPPFDELVYIH